MRLTRVIYHRLAKKYHYNISQNMDLYEHHRKLWLHHSYSRWDRRRIKRAIGWTLLAACVIGFIFGLPAGLAAAGGTTYAAELLTMFTALATAVGIAALICLIIWLID